MAERGCTTLLEWLFLRVEDVEEFREARVVWKSSK